MEFSSVLIDNELAVIFDSINKISCQDTVVNLDDDARFKKIKATKMYFAHRKYTLKELEKFYEMPNKLCLKDDCSGLLSIKFKLLLTQIISTKAYNIFKNEYQDMFRETPESQICDMKYLMLNSIPKSKRKARTKEYKKVLDSQTKHFSSYMSKKYKNDKYISAIVKSFVKQTDMEYQKLVSKQKVVVASQKADKCL